MGTGRAPSRIGGPECRDGGKKHPIIEMLLGQVSGLATFMADEMGERIVRSVFARPASILRSPRRRPFRSPWRPTRRRWLRFAGTTGVSGVGAVPRSAVKVSEFSSRALGALRPRTCHESRRTVVITPLTWGGRHGARWESRAGEATRASARRLCEGQWLPTDRDAMFRDSFSFCCVDESAHVSASRSIPSGPAISGRCIAVHQQESAWRGRDPQACSLNRGSCVPTRYL